MRQMERLVMCRARSGGALILSISLGLAVLLLSLFGLSVIRQLATHQEQTTAIEAAALAATTDISRVIINDPNFGYVGLVDHAPQGVGVAAPDGYGLPVHSINSILATIRLDMIIAEQLKDAKMLAFAAIDYANAQAASANLKAALEDCLLETPSGKYAPTNSGSYTDSTGATINAYQDAVAAYQKNVVRMQGPSKYVANSLKLNLGFASGVATRTPIPSPASIADVTQTQQQNGFYAANMNVPYRGYNFWFTALNNQDLLIANSNFAALNNSPTLSVPSAVQAQADQLFDSNQSVVHAIAAAQVGGQALLLLAPGALVLNFPDGCPSDFSTLQTMLNYHALSEANVNWYQPNGDYPQGDYALAAPGTQTTLVGSNPGRYMSALPSTAGGSGSAWQNHWCDSIRLGIYLWLKRGGPCVNVQAVSNLMNSNLGPVYAKGGQAAGPTVPAMLVYTFDTVSGGINKTALECTYIYASNSDRQLVASSSDSIAVKSLGGQLFDLVMNYNVLNPNQDISKGPVGNHGGEPIRDRRLNNPPLAPGFSYQTYSLTQTQWSSYGWASPCGGWAYSRWNPSWLGNTNPAGGDNTIPVLPSEDPANSPGQIRPSYQTNGVAVELALHRVRYALQQWHGAWGSKPGS